MKRPTWRGILEAPDDCMMAFDHRCTFWPRRCTLHTVTRAFTDWFVFYNHPSAAITEEQRMFALLCLLAERGGK